MSGLGVVAAGVAGVVAKATLVLCLALALAWFARRGSARTLHLLWTTAFVLLLALPVLSLLGPSWTVPILPARDVETRGESFVLAVEEASAPGIARETLGSTISSGSPRRMEGSMALSGSDTEASSPSQPGAGDVRAPLTLAGLAFLIWALGCGAALISLGVGSRRFRKLVRAAAPVRNPAWRHQADTIRRRLRMRSQVRILISPKVPTPMAGGPWRPVILLPSVAEAWSPERRAVVLAHELIHVRRRDALRQVMGRCVVALYWFHPLSWPAWRAAAIAAERSCDEEVLELGTRPSEYARHLFTLASETTDHRALLALPVVQRSQLENRIMSILKQHRPRYSFARTIAALAGIGVAGTLIACANPVPRDPDPQPSPQVEPTVPGEAHPQERVIPAPSAEPASSANPAPVSTPVSEPPPEPASVPEAALAAPEVARDAGQQAFACNPGNGVTVRRQGGEWTLQRRVDGMRLCMRTTGNVEMASNGTTIQSLDADSWLVLESQAERLHRLVVTPGPSGLEYGWSIDGRPETFDDEAEEWRDLMLTVMNGYLDAQQIRGEQASLRGEIAVHRGNVSTLRGRIATHRGQVATLHGEIATHRGQVATLHGEIAAHRGQVATLRGEVAAHRGHVAVLRGQTARHASATARIREVSESVRESLERVDVQEAIEAARQALETGDLAEALQVAAAALETPEVQETMADMAELADDWATLADNLQQIERDFAARRAELEQEVADLEREGMREIEAEIEEYDLAGRVAAIEAQIEEYDLDGKVRELEAQIEAYNLDGRIREIEAQIEELDADRRADEIERSIQDDIAALRRLIG